MPYQNFVSFFYKADVAYFGDWKKVVTSFKAKIRQNQITIHNPVAQKVYIMGELFSDRHYPRAKKCAPNNNVVLYLETPSHDAVEPLLPYQFIAWWGFGSGGKLEGDLPAGDYVLWVVNQNHPRGPKDITFNIYASNELPTMTGLS